MRALTILSILVASAIMLPNDIHAATVNTTTLTNQESYNFATQTAGALSGGDFYFYSQEFWANNVGQQGVQDLGAVPLLSIASIPTAGYTQFGVPAVVGHSYVAIANTGEPGDYIFFQVTALTANSVTINWIFGSAAPGPATPATPAPPSLLLGLIGLAGSGLFLAYRRKARA
jgi:hypothetical protein